MNEILQSLCSELISAHKAPKKRLFSRRYHQAKALTHLVAAELPGKRTSSPPVRLLDTLKHIHSHLGDNLRVNRLAEISGYSPEYLSTLFRKHCRQTPHAYIRDVRMREAARRLAYTQDSIDRIAGDLGYANRHHFTRLFGQSLNESPAKFRKRHCIENKSIAEVNMQS
jgi:AraC-like DNA-binding protein